jgi:hypothetical protein
LKVFEGVREGAEPGRERVEEWRESAVEARRESAGESGAGRDEKSESRDECNELRADLRLSSDGLAVSSVAVVTAEVGGVLEIGVEGDADVPPTSSSGVEGVSNVASGVPLGSGSLLARRASTPALYDDFAVDVVALPFTSALESGLAGSSALANAATRPLLLPPPLAVISVLSLRLSRVGRGSVTGLGVVSAVAPTG